MLLSPSWRDFVAKTNVARRQDPKRADYTLFSSASNRRASNLASSFSALKRAPFKGIRGGGLEVGIGNSPPPQDTGIFAKEA
jgi:hypothetical protein